MSNKPINYEKQGLMLLGIDISTTGAKAILISPQGKVLKTATHTYPLLTPKPLWSEQNPEDWWQAAQASIRQVLEASETDPEAVQAVGLTGQMHGLVLMDAQDQVLCPAILWNDQRTADACKQMVERISPARVIRITGNPALTGFTAPKLLWVREHEPEIYRSIAHILLPKDYVRFKLSGDRAIDCADASGTSLFDISQRKWSQEILDKLEINPNWMPSVFEGTEITGVVSNWAAELTGLASGTPIIGGGGDQAAQAVGVGAIMPEILAVTLGTSGVVFAPTAEPHIDPQGRVHAMCHSLPPNKGQGWHMMGVMLSAGGSLRWLRDKITSEKDYTKIIEPAESIPPGAEGLLFLPYLTGERTPHPDPLARGAFIGLTLRHSLVHITRAILEGVAFGLRDNLELLKEVGVRDIQQVRLSGGGAMSSIWRQILADVLAVELSTVQVTEGASYGAALLAGVGVGLWPSVASACADLIKIEALTTPIPGNVDRYLPYYEQYRSLYPSLRETFKILSTTSSKGAL